MRTVLFIFILTLALVSCKKDKASPYAGTYYCKVDYSYWDMTPTSYDSTWYTYVEVKHEGSKIMVLDYEIPADSIADGEEYMVGYVHNNFTVQFKGDSLICAHHSGGLGGSADTEYRGKKIE